MQKLLLFFLLGSLLCSCHKKEDPETGPVSIVSYKIDGKPVEIRGLLITDSTGSKYRETITYAGRTGPLFSQSLYATSYLNTFSFSNDWIADSISYTVPAEGTNAYF